jgi:hypothetical protein
MDRESKFWNSSKWARKLSKGAGLLSGDGGKEARLLQEMTEGRFVNEHVVSVSKTCWSAR